MALDGLNDWNISGRLGFKSEKETFSATLNWRQQSQDYQLRLSNLVGVTLLSIQGNADQASIEFDDNVYRHSDAQTLIYQLTEWDIPVKSLRYWVKGQLRQDKMFNITFANGLLSAFEQDGWQVSLQQYREVNNTWLPHAVVINKGTNQLKIRIKQWTLR